MRCSWRSSPPFAMKRPDGSWTGISIELWRRIADELDLEYEFREYEIPEMVERLLGPERYRRVA